MIQHTRRAFLALLAAGAIVAASPATAQDAATDQATTFIRSLADQAINALTPPEISRAERRERFRTMLEQHFDVQAIGRFVLGRYWRKASEEQRDEYMSLFKDYIIATYVDRFREYSGVSLKLLGATKVAEGDVVVQAQIMRPSGEPVRVDWRVMRGSSDEEFRIVDVIVEGVSMSQTQRSEFGSVVQRKGIDGLLDALRRMTESLYKE